MAGCATCWKEQHLGSKNTHRKRLLTRKKCVEIEKLSSGNMTNLAHRVKQYHKKEYPLLLKAAKLSPCKLSKKEQLK